MTAPPAPYGPVQTWLRFALGFIAVALTSGAYFALCIPLLPFRALRVRLGNVAGWTMGRGAVAAVGTRVRLLHGERFDARRPAIYIANHTSTLDTFLSIGWCPIGTAGIVKAQVTRIPAFGQAYWLSGHLRIERSDRSGAIEAMARLSAFVKRAGLGIWLMPEGTRSVDGRLQPLKKGFIHLALATGLPVVPVLFHGAHRRWPHKTLSLAPGEVTIEVCAPIDTTGWSGDTIDDHLAEVTAVFADGLREDQRPA